MSELSNFSKILVDICSHGCKLIVHNIGYGRLGAFYMVSELKSYLPKSMVFFDYLVDSYESNIMINGIGTNCHANISDYCNETGYIYLVVKGSIINELQWGNCYNYTCLDTLIHLAYTNGLEKSLIIPIDYKKNLWNFMYDECFGKISIMFLILCDKYLISDIKKLIIDLILKIEKWTNLGFYCVNNRFTT